MKTHWVVATRKSRLALAQTRAFVATLTALHPRLEVRELAVTTSGDRILDAPLFELGGKGLFVKEIEEALREGRADFAVHSMKDVPSALLPELCIRCVPRREDPRDVVVTRHGTPLATLAPGSRVGTSSLRRRAQLLAWRPDLVMVPLRGNVDTRIARCREGAVDAVVLARAGLVRLGIVEQATEILAEELCLPAVGQGALAIECRRNDGAAAELLAPLHDAETALRVAAERGVLQALGGGCDLPIAALADRAGDRMRLRGLFVPVQGVGEGPGGVNRTASEARGALGLPGTTNTRPTGRDPTGSAGPANPSPRGAARSEPAGALVHSGGADAETLGEAEFLAAPPVPGAGVAVSCLGGPQSPGRGRALGTDGPNPSGPAGGASPSLGGAAIRRAERVAVWPQDEAEACALGLELGTLLAADP